MREKAHQGPLLTAGDQPAAGPSWPQGETPSRQEQTLALTKRLDWAMGRKTTVFDHVHLKVVFASHY